MSESERYSMNVRWSSEDECFIALSPEWPGLSAFGPTREEAIKEAGIALVGFIETALEHKMELPPIEKVYPPDCDSGECLECRRCYRAYVEA